LKFCWPITLFEDIDRQHIEIAADHLRDPEIAHGIRERDHRRTDETILRTRQRDRVELAPGPRPERLRRFIKPPIGEQQRGQNDHQRVREYGIDRADDDAERTVDRNSPQQRLQ
jgi:hypothetical protein